MGILQLGVDVLRGKKQLMIKPSHKVMSYQEPEIYNRFGDKLNVFYLKDHYWGPYGGDSGGSRFLFWDRYNFGLTTHFYSHRDMLKTDGKPLKKYGMFNEAETIVPEDYKIFDRHKGLAKEFVKIFTWSEKLLNELDNAELFAAQCAWVTNEDSKLCDKKSKMVSMICSNKAITEYHHLRIRTARKLKEQGLVDVFGNLDGGQRFEKKEITLDDYRFHVVVENGVSDYYFSEKILDCFVEMTIPVYIGARKIGELFNPDGIIQIKPQDYDRIDEIVKKLDAKYYEEHMEAVKDNFNRVQEYINLNDYIYKRM